MSLYIKIKRNTNFTFTFTDNKVFLDIESLHEHQQWRTFQLPQTTKLFFFSFFFHLTFLGQFWQTWLVLRWCEFLREAGKQKNKPCCVQKYNLTVQKLHRTKPRDGRLGPEPPAGVKNLDGITSDMQICDTPPLNVKDLGGTEWDMQTCVLTKQCFVPLLLQRYSTELLSGTQLLKANWFRARHRGAFCLISKHYVLPWTVFTLILNL